MSDREKPYDWGFWSLGGSGSSGWTNGLGETSRIGDVCNAGSRIAAGTGQSARRRAGDSVENVRYGTDNGWKKKKEKMR